MKTVASVLALTVMATAAHAQTAYETRTTTSTETVGNVTTQVQTDYVSTTTMMPAAIGDAPATPAVEATGGVKVKMPNGDMLTIADSEDAPWNKDSRLQGYDRFTFDPVSGAFVAGMGEEKFAGNWDENGNRIKKAPAPKAKKKAVKVEATEDVKTEAPATEAPVMDAPAEVPAETPAASTPADMPATTVPAEMPATPAAQ